MRMNVAAIMEPLVFVAPLCCFCWLASFPNDQHYRNPNASFKFRPSKCCGHCYAGMQ
ncbi:hypothetical protein M5D96_000065, partial [Drosophila gunungcola]